MSLHDDIQRLCAAGAIQAIVRVGHQPFDTDDPIEITFEGGRVFTIDIGFEGATDLRVAEGRLLDLAFGHLRVEEPETFAGIADGWTTEPIDLPWAIGQVLSSPRRLAMTNPYRVDVGYVFDCGDRQLALFGEADLIFAAALDDPDIESFKLEVGA